MDLRAQLQQHLGSAYTIDRELGGGGMSRVFLATESRLRRQVVIKVLSPELAQGLNAERFEREIQLAASLQQANIVPVLVAGDLEGLPYFTMPFVEGESLRQRLTQGAVPVTEAVGILRDVARALAYAHARGVVHRDIKPDNVLLSGGAAVVTDFGIAKAISASRTAAPGATLTQLGTSIGTPAYMAPEQVAGDPNIDHRVDLYALGCTAFELLTGQQPFANRTPQRTLAAHLSEAIPVVTTLRADTPPALAALVQRLMAKDPADRPSTAAEVVQSLDQAVTSSAPTLAFSAGTLKRALSLYVVMVAVVLLCTKAAIIAIGLPDWVFPGAILLMALGLPALLITAYVQRVARHIATATPTLTPGGTMAPRGASGTMATMALKASPYLTWRRAWRGGAWAVGGFALVVALFMVTRALGIGPWGSLLAAGKLSANDRIILAGVDVPPSDSALAPIVSEAIRAALAQSRSINLVSQSDIADVLQEMKRPRDARLDDPSLVHDVAQRTNAKAVLSGHLARLGAGYAVSLELTAAQGGATLASYQATAAGSQDLLPVIDGLTRKLRGKVGESLKQVQQSIPLERATTTSLAALRKYSDAVVENDIDQNYDGAVRSAREAVALDSTFALAWRKLAVALYNGGGSAVAQDSAIDRAAHYADRLPDREKYLALGYYYENSLSGADRGKAVAAYASAYAADSSDATATAANQLGMLYDQRHQKDSALRYFRRELHVEPIPTNVAKVAYQLTLNGQAGPAIAALDSLSKAAPQSVNSLMTSVARISAFVDDGQRDSAIAVATALARSPDPAMRLYGLRILSSDLLLVGRLQRAAATDSELAAWQVSQNLAPPFALTAAMADILFRGRTADGVKLLDEMVAGRAWAAAQPPDRPYLKVISLYARAGRTDRARSVLTQMQSDDIEAKAPDAKADLASASGQIALAEGKTADALGFFRAAAARPDGQSVECGSCIDYELATTFDHAGQADSAITYFRHYLARPAAERASWYYVSDPEDLAAVEKRLGDLYDARHQNDSALVHYTAFVDQWKNADPDLQPVVTQVKQRITELTAAEGH